MAFAQVKNVKQNSKENTTDFIELKEIFQFMGYTYQMDKSEAEEQI